MKEGYPDESLAWHIWAFFRSQSLLALQWIGLDFHGGLEALLETHNIGREQQFPAINFILRDPEKANRYIDIGIRIDASLDIEFPRNMVEAAQSYLETVALVDDQDSPKLNREELLESIAARRDENEKWPLRHELFRHTVKAKYEDLLIEKSQDLYLEKLEKKRDYLNKSERETELAEMKRRRILKELLEAKFMEKMESIEEDNSFEAHMQREDQKRGLQQYHAYRKKKRLDLTQRMLKKGGRKRGTPSVYSTASSED